VGVAGIQSLAGNGAGELLLLREILITTDVVGPMLEGKANSLFADGARRKFLPLQQGRVVTLSMAVVLDEVDSRNRDRF